MLQGIPKISVLVITYNQEGLISRALDSLIIQKNYIYEICVSDDCSNDRTWNILQEYSARYPGLFVLNRNKSNVGIFENIETTWEMPTGDLIYSLSGDDECPNGWFSEVLTYIESNDIDYLNERVVIYGDYECKYPSGDSFVFSNKRILSQISPLRLSLRGHIGNRSAVCSKKVIEAYKKVSMGKSYVAECAQDLQLPLHADKVYYIPSVGNIYYTRIGVSARMDESKLKEREKLYIYAMSMIQQSGYVLQESDIAYIYLRTFKLQLYRKKTIDIWWKIFKMSYKSFDYNLSFKFFNIKRYWFAFLIRMPHKRKVRLLL